MRSNHITTRMWTRDINKWEITNHKVYERKKNHIQNSSYFCIQCEWFPFHTHTRTRSKGFMCSDGSAVYLSVQFLPRCLLLIVAVIIWWLNSNCLDPFELQFNRLSLLICDFLLSAQFNCRHQKKSNYQIYSMKLFSLGVKEWSVQNRKPKLLSKCKVCK